MGGKKNILIITRWFPDLTEPTKCVFTQNIVDHQAQSEKYEFTVISPIPYCPKIIGLPGLRRFSKFSKINYKENRGNYMVFRPKYFKLPHPIMKKAEWYTYFKAVLRVIEKEKIGFDLIHSHGVFPDSFVAMKVGQFFNVPTIVHLHETFFDEEYRVYHSEIDELAKQAQCGIAVSEFQKGIVGSKCDDFFNKTRVVHNGVDTNKFIYGSCGSEKKERLIFIGHLIERKGVDLLLNALNILKNEIEFHLDIYGSGKDEKLYKKMVDDLDLSRIVSFKGLINNGKLPKVLRGYSLLVMPSRYETFGIVLIEAMSCGVPVVATDIEPIREIVSTDEVGVLFAPENPASLAMSIKQAMDKKWDHREIREHAKKFSIDNTVKNIE